MMNKFAPGTQNFDRVRSVIFNFTKDAEKILARRDNGQLSTYNSLEVKKKGC
jgi:hypothetical protein